MGKGSRPRPCFVSEEERRANWDLIFGKKAEVGTGVPYAWREHLAGMPESGMGYQDVIVTLKDGREIRTAVLNGEEFQGLTADQVKDIAGIRSVK